MLKDYKISIPKNAAKLQASNFSIPSSGIIATNKGLLTEPVETIEGSTRWYWVPQCKEYFPSVTSVIHKGFPTSPGLMTWFKNNTASHVDKISQDAMALGTEAHAIAEKYIKGGCDIMILNPQERVKIAGFLKWVSDYKPKFLEVEKAIFINQDGMKVAGRFDILAEVEGTRTLIDLKRSKSIYESYPVQISVYAKAMDCDVSAILRLADTKKGYQYKTFTVADKYEVFKACYQVALYMGLFNNQPISKEIDGEA